MLLALGANGKTTPLNADPDPTGNIWIDRYGYAHYRSRTAPIPDGAVRYTSHYSNCPNGTVSEDAPMSGFSDWTMHERRYVNARHRGLARLVLQRSDGPYPDDWRVGLGGRRRPLSGIVKERVEQYHGRAERMRSLREDAHALA
jgi:hypothetical protein